MSKKLVWYYWADEMAETPELVDGHGFCVTRLDDYGIWIEVYDTNMQDPGNPPMVMHVWVKWDGCVELSDVSLHLCGSKCWANEMELIREAVFKLTAERVKCFDAALANYEPGRALVEMRNEWMPAELEGR